MTAVLAAEMGASAARLLHAWTLAQRGQVEEVRAWLEQLPLDEVVAEPELGVLLLNAYMYTFDARAVTLEQALVPVFAARGNDRLLRRFLNFRGFIRLREGALSEAAAYFDEVEWMSEAANDDWTLAYALTNTCAVSFARLEVEQAMRAAERGLALSRRTGDVRSTAHLLHNLGILYRHLGMYPEAERHLDRARHYPLSAAEKALSDQEHALLYLLMGRVEAADALARRAFAAVASEGLHALRADAWRVVAMVSLARKNTARAERELRRALAFCGGADPQTHAQILEELAAVAVEAGRQGESEELERAAAGIYARMEAPRQVDRLRERLQELRRS